MGAVLASLGVVARTGDAVGVLVVGGSSWLVMRGPSKACSWDAGAGGECADLLRKLPLLIHALR